MHASDVGPKVEDDAYRRAVRSVPGSGEIWARYIRFSVIFFHLPRVVVLNLS
jgi:hypothetical protein